MSMPLAAVLDDRCRDKGSRASPRLADGQHANQRRSRAAVCAPRFSHESDHRLQPRSTLRTELHRAAGSAFKLEVSAPPSRPPTRTREPYPTF